MITRLPQALNNIFRPLFYIIWMIAIAIVGLFPKTDAATTGALFSESHFGELPLDKFSHAIAFGMATLSGSFALVNQRNVKIKPKTKTITLAAGISFIYGIIIEVLQETLTNSRELETGDLVANTTGILLAVMGLYIWYRR